MYVPFLPPFSRRVKRVVPTSAFTFPSQQQELHPSAGPIDLTADSPSPTPQPPPQSNLGEFPLTPHHPLSYDAPSLHLHSHSSASYPYPLVAPQSSTPRAHPVASTSTSHNSDPRAYASRNSAFDRFLLVPGSSTDPAVSSTQFTSKSRLPPSVPYRTAQQSSVFIRPQPARVIERRTSANYGSEVKAWGTNQQAANPSLRQYQRPSHPGPLPPQQQQSFYDERQLQQNLYRLPPQLQQQPQQGYSPPDARILLPEPGFEHYPTGPAHRYVPATPHYPPQSYQQPQPPRHHSPPSNDQIPPTDDDMASRKAVPITVSDPSRLVSIAGKAGWSSLGFNDDDDGDLRPGQGRAKPVAANGRGRGRGGGGGGEGGGGGGGEGGGGRRGPTSRLFTIAQSQSVSTKNTGRRWDANSAADRPHAATQQDAIDKLQFQRVRRTSDAQQPSTVRSSDFHAPTAGPSSSSSSLYRAIQQDDPDTQREMDGLARQRQLEREAGGRKVRAGGGQGQGQLSVKSAAGRGKGKGKQVDTIDLASSDEGEIEVQQQNVKGKGKASMAGAWPEEDDPIENADDDDDDELALHHARPQPQPTKLYIQMQQRQQRYGSYGHDINGPSSPDALASNLTGKGQGQMRTNGAAAGTSARGSESYVHGLIGHWEQKSGGQVKEKKKMANSLQPKQQPKQPKPNLDGAGTDDADWDRPTAVASPSSNAPCTAASSSKRGRKTSGGASRPDIVKIAIHPYMLGRRHICPHFLEDEYSLTLNSIGPSRGHQLTLERKAHGEAEGHEIAIMKREHFSSAEWCTLVEDKAHSPAFWFRLKNDKTATLAKLCDEDWLTPEELSEDEKGVLFISKEPFSASSDREPTVPVDYFRDTFSSWQKDSRFEFTQMATNKVAAFEGPYNAALDAAREFAAKSGRQRAAGASSSRSSNAKSRASNGGIQSTLSFNGSHNSSPYQTPGAKTGGRLIEDTRGDFRESSEQPLEQLRRSSRKSTSEYATQHAKPAEWDPYPPEQVVLEYPINEPGAGAVSVTYADKKRLNDDEFLNDTLIEFGLKRVLTMVKEADEKRPEGEKIAPLVHVFNSFFYKKLSTKKPSKAQKDWDSYSLVEKWTKKINLFEKKYIIVPINEHLHWYLAIIVNPGWIVQHAEHITPPPDTSAQPPATRVSAAEEAFALSSTPLAAPAAAEADTSPHFAQPGPPATEGDDVEMAEQDSREAEIQAQIREAAEHTEMGPGDDDADNMDVTMFVDPNVEGGGPLDNRIEVSPEPGSPGGDQAMVISDDGDEQDSGEPATATTASSSSSSEEGVVQERLPQSSASVSKPAAASSSAAANPPAKKATPTLIAVPTAPPKGATPPPPEQEPSRMDLDNNASSEDLARQLGAGENSTDQCWIFTFDSLGADHNPVIEKLKKYLDMEAKKKLGKTHTASHLVKGASVKVPIQPNSCDCGLYLLHFVEKFLANPDWMLDYIVSNVIKPPRRLRPGQKANEDDQRIRDQHDAATIREDVWNAREAHEKRAKMRQDVERLMKTWELEVLPLRRKQAEEEERKRVEREEKKRQRLAEAAARFEAEELERRRGEQAATDAAGQCASRPVLPMLAQPPPSKKAKKAITRGKGKKAPEELVLSDDDSSTADSPKKSQMSPVPLHPQPPPPARPPAKPEPQHAPLPPAPERGPPCSTDFLPESAQSRPPTPSLRSASPPSRPAFTSVLDVFMSSPLPQPAPTPLPPASAQPQSSQAPQSSLSALAINYQSDSEEPLNDDSGDLNNSQSQSQSQSAASPPSLLPLASRQTRRASASPQHQPRQSKRLKRDPTPPVLPHPSATPADSHIHWSTDDETAGDVSVAAAGDLEASSRSSLGKVLGRPLSPHESAVEDEDSPENHQASQSPKNRQASHELPLPLANQQQQAEQQGTRKLRPRVASANGTGCPASPGTVKESAKRRNKEKVKKPEPMKETEVLELDDD
ncbi:hypothetical protein JCM1841_003488 [Sporobolomyces salmonicolor]